MKKFFAAIMAVLMVALTAGAANATPVSGSFSPFVSDLCGSDKVLSGPCDGVGESTLKMTIPVSLTLPPPGETLSFARFEFNGVQSVGAVFTGPISVLLSMTGWVGMAINQAASDCYGLCAGVSFDSAHGTVSATMDSLGGRLFLPSFLLTGVGNQFAGANSIETTLIGGVAAGANSSFSTPDSSSWTGNTAPVVSSVPEPSSLILALVGGAGLLLARRAAGNFRRRDAVAAAAC